jgi:hypothetical protein
MFGMTLSTGLRLPGLKPVDAPESTSSCVTVDLVARDELERRFSGLAREPAALALGDGVTVSVSTGRQADVLLSYGEQATFHIAPGGAAVGCAPAEPDALAWQRVLLDTVLGTAALCRGHEGLHAAAVELPEGVVAVAAPSGGGKTTVCAELIHRGARLFTDDLVFLTRVLDRVVAHPGPPVMSVPLDRECVTSALGERLAVFGDEAWVAVPGAARDARPMRALVVLDRRPDLDGARLEAEPLAVFGNALDSGAQAARRRARFELLADLAEQAAVLRLVAGPNVTPPALAALVESAASRSVSV